MKNNFFTLKQRFLITLLLFSLGTSLFSQELTKDVTQSGSLSTILSDEEKANTVKLKITTSNGATLNSTDFDILNKMPKLKELDLSDDLNTTSLPGNAFADNQTIETINFPANLKSIGGGAFNNSALKGTVTFPKTVTGMGDIIGRFGNCQGITAFNFPDNRNFSTHEGVLYFTGDDKITRLVRYPCGKDAESYTMKEGAQTIEEQAFFYNKKLKKLILSTSFEKFAKEDAIFRDVTALESIDVESGNATFASIGGLLLNKTTKSLVYFPPANKTENLTIDGNLVEKVPAGFFSNARSLKRVIFTEGFKEVGYRAFRTSTTEPLPIVYIELPSTMTTINGEAFANCNNMTQFICRATTPPKITGNSAFRESNNTKIKFGIPESAIDAYLKSDILDENYAQWVNDGNGGSSQTGPKGNGWSFKKEQIVPYKEITIVGGTVHQNVSVPGYQIEITAGKSPEETSFTHWESEPQNVTFIDSKATNTFFTMPESNVTITAVFEKNKPYTIIGATITKDGKAPIGSTVNIDTDFEKQVDGQTLTFQKWVVNKGDGVIINNPAAISTSFVMIDGEVEIEAIYTMTYTINIQGGIAPFEAAEGDKVEISASQIPGQEFVSWTSTTSGVEFDNPNSPETFFIMPPQDVDIIANFKQYTDIDNTTYETLSVFPNPATDYISITGTKNGIYSIYNTFGNLMKQGKFNGENISISELPIGIYFLRINNTTIRFIKK